MSDTVNQSSQEMVARELPAPMPPTLPPAPPVDASALLNVFAGPAVLAAVSMADHEAFAKEAQERELALKQQLSDLGTELVTAKEQLEARELLVKQQAADLATAKGLLGYVLDWLKSRSERKIHSFEVKKRGEIAAFLGAK